ncbi:protein DpdH [Solimonas sp. SE-A11]|uniref:protein DpdH n=1 Tax=Solimonas sp. SE-A11 TaxID=3054954 RepID=UPI00259CEB35|nr:protein DpdH [Solimonas sp. SE-A11]MDM4769072.1 protein DpdH [Solimonas sp. SE-A11]
MSLDQYWPSLANIDSCIRTEAETIDPAVLLAVHEPGPLRLRSALGASEEAKTEKDLLDALLRPADDGSTVVVAITGDSGVGKSHMIRWLHAHLERHPRREHLVVVLVPKTASLRQVVELILEPLEVGRYQKLKGELSKAVETLGLNDASEMLAAALGNELERKYREGMQSLRENQNTADRVARERVDAARGLRHVLRDPGVRDRWFGEVLKRIVRQAIEGGSEADTGKLRRFTPEDLQAPDDWAADSATEDARRYLQQLQANDGSRRPTAAAVLQDVLDPALRGVFRFSEALGQRTIEEIVSDIRQELLTEGKELVLLIEDFAALAGIQQPLLNLMIAESDHQGRRIRAPLRTALAVTDGFLPSRQTILTRAKHEWIIPNTAASEEEIVLRYIDMAGRYLNSARWGAQALQEQYAEGANSGLNSWVKAYREPLSADEAEMLEAFGRSRHGHSLFPLSRESIEALCRKELRQGNRLLFKPRDFINSVLRDTLQLRPEYVRRAFPPSSFKNAVPAAAVEYSLRAQALSQSVKDRMAPVIVYWAGNPQDLSGPARVPKGIFQAFGLPWPYQGERVVSAPLPPVAPPLRDKPVVVQEGTQAPVSPVPEEKPGTPGLLEQIEAWAGGERLPQVQARQIRQLLVLALKDRFDWNAHHMRAASIEMGQIWLPFVAAGNPTADPKFIAGEETRPLSATLRAGVLALDRWSANARSWDYPGSEDDYAPAQQLLDHLEKQVSIWFAKQAQRQAAVALRTLHRRALMLRLSKAAEPALPRLVDYCGSPETAPPQPEDGDQSPAGMIMAASARAAKALPELRRVLFDSVGCFQGTGSQLFAIDSYRLRLAWKAEEVLDDPLQIKAELQLARETANELCGARAPALVNRYRMAVEAMVPKIASFIGSDAEEGIVQSLRDLVGKGHKMGVFPGDFTLARAKRELDFLSEDAAKAILRRVAAFTPPTEDASLHKRLASWAEWDIPVLRKVLEALGYLNDLLQALERAAKAELRNLGGGDVAAAVAKLKSDLEVLAKEAGT